MAQPPDDQSGKPPKGAVPPVPSVSKTPTQVPVIRPISPQSPVPRIAPSSSATTASRLDSLVEALDRLDYFEILQLAKNASRSEIKKAFHQGSRAYHPDRFYQLTDEALKAKVGRVYKRMTEAYYVLRDDAKRQKYLADIESEERSKKLRFSELAEAETKQELKKQHEEQIGATPKGRQFYATAMADMDAQRWSAAERSLKMALTYEPTNPRYKEKLMEIQQRMYQETKERGETFKIK
ncbi:MAG TPA: DnaJ domain-containing protein [Myxococcales bacterium]